MASVNEEIVREYFEAQGFLARQPRKYQVAARARISALEEVDLLVFNPAAGKGALPPIGIWSGAELRQVRQAVVGVRGWHTEKFSPSVLKLAPEVCRFAADEVVEQVRGELDEGPVARILCVSDLPTSRALRKETFQVLAENKVDGVLLFPLLLLELFEGIDPNKNYARSDLLQLLRILKSYDLVKDRQMELFKKRRLGAKG